MGVRRRLRVLEEYYNFDEDGDAYVGNPSDDGDAEGVKGIKVDTKGGKEVKGGSKRSEGSKNTGSSKSSAAVGARDGGSDSYSGGGSGSYSGGGSSSYGGSGRSSYSGGAGSSYSGGSGSYSGGSGSYNGGGAGSYHSPSKFSRDFDSMMKKVNVDVPLVPVITVATVLIYCGMVYTAFMYQARPDSTFTSCCRLTVNCIRSACAITLNLYHCRLGDIPPIICAMDDADDLDDEELERMTPRPGIVKALHIEHQKALSRVEVASNPSTKPSQALMAKIFG